MLSFLSILSGIGWRGWLMIALSVTVLGFAGRYEMMKHAVEKADNAVSKLNITVANQSDTIQTQQVVQKLNDLTHIAVQQTVKQTVAQHQAIADKVDAQEHQITTHFAQLPISPVNLKNEQTQLSETRIDGIWAAYCTAKPDDASCQATQGEPHA